MHKGCILDFSLFPFSFAHCALMGNVQDTMENGKLTADRRPATGDCRLSRLIRQPDGSHSDRVPSGEDNRVIFKAPEECPICRKGGIARKLFPSRENPGFSQFMLAREGPGVGTRYISNCSSLLIRKYYTNLLFYIFITMIPQTVLKP